MDRSRRRIAGPGAAGAALKQDGVNSPAPDSSVSISNKMLGVKEKKEMFSPKVFPMREQKQAMTN